MSGAKFDLIGFVLVISNQPRFVLIYVQLWPKCWINYLNLV